MRFLFGALFGALFSLLPLTAVAQNETLTDIGAAFDLFSGDPSDQNRRTLLDALALYDGPPTVNTVNAHLTIMMHDAPSNEYELISESAGAATQHLEPIAELLPKQYLDARFIAAVAQFNGSEDPDAVLEMAHIQGVTRAMSDDASWDEWAKSLHYRAYAWAEAIVGSRAVKRSAREPLQNQVDEILSSYPDPQAEAEALREDALEWCEGDVKFRRKPRYPIQALQKGRVGVVVLGLEFDEEGKAANTEVLSAVPEGIFEKDSLKWVQSAYYKPEDKSAVGKTCKLNRTNIVQTLAFGIG